MPNTGGGGGGSDSEDLSYDVHSDSSDEQHSLFNSALVETPSPLFLAKGAKMGTSREGRQNGASPAPRAPPPTRSLGGPSAKLQAPANPPSVQMPTDGLDGLKAPRAFDNRESTVHPIGNTAKPVHSHAPLTAGRVPSNTALNIFRHSSPPSRRNETGALPRPQEHTSTPSPENSFTNHMLDSETSMLGYSQQVPTFVAPHTVISPVLSQHAMSPDSSGRKTRDRWPLPPLPLRTPRGREGEEEESVESRRSNLLHYHSEPLEHLQQHALKSQKDYERVRSRSKSRERKRGPTLPEGQDEAGQPGQAGQDDARPYRQDPKMHDAHQRIKLQKEAQLHQIHSGQIPNRRETELARAARPPLNAQPLPKNAAETDGKSGGRRHEQQQQQQQQQDLSGEGLGSKRNAPAPNQPHLQPIHTLQPRPITNILSPRMNDWRIASDTMGSSALSVSNPSSSSPPRSSSFKSPSASVSRSTHAPALSPLGLPKDSGLDRGSGGAYLNIRDGRGDTRDMSTSPPTTATHTHMSGSPPTGAVPREESGGESDKEQELLVQAAEYRERVRELLNMLRQAEATAADEHRYHQEATNALQGRIQALEASAANDLAASRSEKDALRKECESRDDELKALKDMLRDAKQDLAEQEAQYATLEQHTQELIGQMRQMEELQKDLEGDYESTLASAQAAERRLSDIEKERDLLLREADGHDANTTSLRLNFEKETEALKRQVDELQGRLREAEKERETIVREADQDRRRQGEEMKSARLKSEEATSKLEEDVRRLKRHMDQLQDQLRESDLANAQLKREIEVGNAQLKRESELANAQLKRDSANADKLLRDFDSAQDLVNLAQSKVNTLTKENCELENEVADLKKALHEHRKEVNERRMNEDTFSADLQACQRQLKSAQEQIDCLEADKEALHNHLANATRKAKQLDLERAEADAHIDHLTGLLERSRMSVIEREGIGERDREGVRERGRQREREGVVPSLPLNRLPEGDGMSERTERDGIKERASDRIRERQLDQVPGSERERDGGGAYSATAAPRANSGVVRPNSPTHLPSVKKEEEEVRGQAWRQAEQASRAGAALEQPSRQELRPSPALNKAAQAQARADELSRAIQDQVRERQVQRERNMRQGQGSVRTSLGGVFGERGDGTNRSNEESTVDAENERRWPDERVSNGPLSPRPLRGGNSEYFSPRGGRGDGGGGVSDTSARSAGGGARKEEGGEGGGARHRGIASYQSPDVKTRSLQRQLVSMNQEKQYMESQLTRLLSKGVLKTGEDRRAKLDLERGLDDVSKQISSLRREVRRMEGESLNPRATQDYKVLDR